MKRPFNKPATTYTEQVTILKQRRMLIDDEEKVKFYLSHLNYYRLSAYWLTFEADHATHQFKSGTHFDDALNLYIFDRELRLLMLDAIERFEVSIRSHWAYHLAHCHGSHAHFDAGLAFRLPLWKINLAKLSEEVHRSDEAFIKHLLGNYSEPVPPVWAVCEVMSLGLLSRWYNNLNPMKTRRAIANVYGLDEAVLQSWLHHLSLIRNICAYHSRLWNREFTITPLLPRTKPAQLKGEFVSNSRRIYNSFVMALYLMGVIAPEHHWRQRLKQLLCQHRVPVEAMGFPENWETRQLWQEK